MQNTKRGTARTLATLATAISLASLAMTAEAAAPALQGYGATSPVVAGISSGGYMAVQMQVAYSATFKGAAVFAGGPYYCAQDNASTATTTCEKNSPAIPLSTLEADTNQWALNGWIDPTANIGAQNVYMYSGKNDTTVYQSVMNVLFSYETNYMKSGNVTYNSGTSAGHGWVTWKTGTGINSCSTTASPYLNNCGNDPEFDLLNKLYGTVTARASSTTGQMLQFDQTAFVPNGNAAYYSLDNTGYVYVPSYCASNSGCKVVVAMHGCKQSYSAIGNAFITNSGLNEYADTNQLIVIYPQTIASSYSTSYNPNGCWDWWGYTGTNYPIKGGVQPSFIKAIVDKVSSAHY
ncbi:extracellular catalytic domain type 2 short-chain-length polyhydroxyalkanoate depolymerase [Noviherbaspirillum pedocola]|uniref:PHA-depolymerase-like protein n=1 Tax=Noviherbaspirillum pedocola TaxID=2801341 RepID=A0A934SVA3_9BURK|nr:PHB depolymerase family esterase [Noviherbaspirillum pedocola]MBK4735978.1 PHA-depolymerase-like protein [Noviherbaspirillum pedocola]